MYLVNIVKDLQKHKNNLIDTFKPRIFCLWEQNRTQSNENKLSQIDYLKQLQFQVKIQLSKEPPKKKLHQNCKLSQLKNQITPVQQIWSKCIKQYLNDSQFVQIYRKNNSLSNQKQPKYGQTIIKYAGQINKTSYNNKSTQQNIFSRAYFKLWQILNTGIFDSLKQKQCNIACLAEGPGGFIHALIDYRLKNNPLIKDKYFAITLKVDQQDYIKNGSRNDWQNTKSNYFFTKIKNQKFDLKLSYGEDQKGDLLNVKNISFFQNVLMKNSKAFLVTGDGGILCSTDEEFHYQEATNAKLFLAQILTSLKIQQINGIFILKIYDCYFEITKQLITLLSLFYQKIQAIKPVTSRPGNSQKYLKCVGFKGISLKEQAQLQKIFLQWNQLQNESDYFNNKKYVFSVIKFKNEQLQGKIYQAIQSMNQALCIEQQKKIQEGLKLIQEHQNSLNLILKNIKNRMTQQINYAYSWCKFYGITSLFNTKQYQKQQVQYKKDKSQQQ